MMRAPFIAGIVAALAAATPAPSLAQDLIAEGKSKAAKCASCHGKDGIARIPNVPHIAAEDVDYLIEQLKAFKTGEREDPQMSVVAQQLSDDDIEALANYYSAIEIKVISTP